jgi:hypothetical protein
MTVAGGALIFARTLIATIFAIASVAKAARFHAFAESVTEFGVPAALRNLVAALVILAETAVPLTLIGPAVAFGFAIVDCLLVTFSVAIYLRVRAGRTAACYCFGGDGTPMDASNIWRNMSLVWFASVGLALCFVPSAIGQRTDLGQSVTIVLLAGIVAIGMIRLPSKARAVAAGAIKLWG